MKTCISKLDVNGEELRLNLDNETLERSVQYKGRELRSFDSLTTDFQELRSNRCIAALAAAANFLFRGMEFIVIEDPSGFKKRYIDRVKDEQTKSKTIKPEDSILSSGNFNLEGIVPPKIEGGHLIFYVEDRNRGIPLKASCPLPFDNERDRFQYDKLPYT